MRSGKPICFTPEQAKNRKAAKDAAEIAKLSHESRIRLGLEKAPGKGRGKYQSGGNFTGGA